MDNHVVIMAGGIGSRFWPMSTPECPKQFIDVMGCGRSLIQLTADRFDGVCPRENMWVVTSEKYINQTINRNYSVTGIALQSFWSNNIILHIQV